LYLLAEVAFTVLRAASVNAPQLFHIPIWADIVLLLLALLLVRHRLHEWKRHRQEAVAWAVMTELFREMAALELQSAEPQQRATALADFLNKFSDAFRVILEAGRKAKVAVSLMRLRSGVLRIEHTYPKEAKFDLTLALAPGKGGAGTAYTLSQMIYIPSVRHQHGIRIEGTTPHLAESVYVPTGTEPFRSVLCVPVFTTEEKFGVLNFSTDKPKTFSPLDFEIGQLAASVLALVLDRVQE
jgi:hypothetical protein